MTAELEKRTHAFEMRCYRKLLNIPYKDHVTNVRRNSQTAIEKYDFLLTLVIKRKLRWFSHISMSTGLANTIPQGTVQGKEEKVDRRRGGKTMLRTGQGWTLQLMTGLGGKGLL